jgi:hypothetical protein
LELYNKKEAADDGQCWRLFRRGANNQTEAELYNSSEANIKRMEPAVLDWRRLLSETVYFQQEAAVAGSSLREHRFSDAFY